MSKTVSQIKSVYSKPSPVDDTGTLGTLISLLSEEQQIRIHPQGYSMFPFFSGYRDTLYIRRPAAEPKRGDIALYRRDNGMYVVHRIHHSKHTTDATGSDSVQYFFLGDQQTAIEGPLDASQILGIVDHYERKGKCIDCNHNKAYLFLSRLWLILRPVRPLFLKGWTILHRLQK